MKDIEIEGNVVGAVDVHREKGKNAIMFVPKKTSDKAISFRSTTALLNYLGKHYHAPLSARTLVASYVGNELLKLKRQLPTTLVKWSETADRMRDIDFVKRYNI